MPSDLSPCPFCGGQTCSIREHERNELFSAVCPCGYESCWYYRRREAVAEHNKVSAAVNGGRGKK